MKIREYQNRFSEFFISGVIIYIPDKMEKKMVIQYAQKDYLMVCDVESYKSDIRKIKFIDLENLNIDLLDLEVYGFADNREPLMEGDYVWVERNNNNFKEKVIHIKESDGSPYPIVTENSQYSWKEIKMVNKKKGLSETQTFF